MRQKSPAKRNFNELPVATLRKLLDCCPGSGTLIWRRRPRSFFKSDRSFKTWNSRFANKPAFISINNHGYLIGFIFGKAYKAHRVIWAHTKGQWPEQQIDHINGLKTDNRICNFRDVSQAKNLRNTCVHKDNESGCSGVSWHKPTSKWRARIRVNGREKHLGLFHELEAAAATRKAAERQYGYHKNHGRAAS